MLFTNHICRARGGEKREPVDFAESAEHEMIRSAVRDLAAPFGHDYFAEQTRTGGKTDELWQVVADHGFLSVHLPPEFGGGGGGITELTIVSEELAAQGCPMLLLLVTAAICAELIARFGSDAQKREWLPALGSGEKMAFAITEPDAGSNTHRLSTTATRDGDIYRLRGTKTYISGVDEARAVLVVARTGTDDITGDARLSMFIVDRDTPGFEYTLIPVEIAAPEKQFQLFFDDVHVPCDRLLGDEHEGLRQVFSGLNPERITGAAICAGLGRYALARASEYARERVVWNVPIGQHQGIAHPLATAKIELELARLMITKAAWLHDHDADPALAGEAANMAKYAAAEAGLHCLDAAIQTHGGNGMASEYGLADLWGLLRLLRIAPVSREMVLNFVAQQSLGLPKSY
jgi:alkylation response protein AidB-like acyl-CoA dehydrogenase